MTEEAKRCVKALQNNIRNGFYLIGNSEFSMSCKDLIDLIGSLSEQLEQVTNERDGLNIMLAQAQAMLETRTKERDAAVRDIRNAAFCGCHVCKHYYRPDQNVRKYACKIYGSFDEHDFIADDGSIFCGAMEWKGVEVDA